VERPFPLRLHQRLSHGPPSLLAPVVAIVLAYLIAAPLLMASLSSFKLTEGSLPFEDAAPWSLANYISVFLKPGTYEVLANTLVFASGSLVVALVASIWLAWLVERTDLPLGKWVYVLIVASIGMPGVISGIAWVLLLNPTNGIINAVLRWLLPGIETGPLDIFSMAGLVFVQGIDMVPITFLLITAAFRAMDPALEDAALTAGSSRLTVMRRITLPLLAPALLGAAIYQFVNVVASFDLPLIIGLRAGIPLLSTEIYTEARPTSGIANLGLASTYAILLMALAAVPLVMYVRMMARSERYATISARGFTPSRVRLGSLTAPAIFSVWIFMVVSLILPLAVMVWASVQPFWSNPSPESLSRVTLLAYERIVASPSMSKVLWNTLLVGVFTALCAMTIGFLAAWVIVRSRSRLRKVMDVMSFAPHAIPGVIIGLSILLFYLFLPVPIYGTIWILVIGLTTQTISLATRMMTGSIVQVDRQLEEAGEVTGASRRSVLSRIVLPLVLPAFLNGALLVFLMGIKHLTVPLMLFTPDTVVLSTLIWNRWDHGDVSITAALGVMMVSVTVTLSILVRRLRGMHPE